MESRLTQYAKNYNVSAYQRRAEGGGPLQVYPAPYEQSGFENAGKPPYKALGNGFDWHNPGGPTWELLRSYYQLSEDKKIKLNNDTEAEFRVNNGGKEAVLSKAIPSNSKTSGVYPVVLNLHHHAWMIPVLEGNDKLASNGDADRPYVPRLFMTPAVVIWNPFNVKLDAQDYYLTIYERVRVTSSEFTLDDVEFGNAPTPLFEWADEDPYRPRIRPNKKIRWGSIHPDSIRFAFYNDNQPGIQNGEIDGDIDTWPGVENGFRYVLKSTGLEPGQAIIFSAPGGAEMTEYGEDGAELFEGYRPETFVYADYETVTVEMVPQELGGSALTEGYANTEEISRSKNRNKLNVPEHEDPIRWKHAVNEDDTVFLAIGTLHKRRESEDGPFYNKNSFVLGTDSFENSKSF